MEAQVSNIFLSM